MHKYRVHPKCDSVRFHRYKSAKKCFQKFYKQLCCFKAFPQKLLPKGSLGTAVPKVKTKTDTYNLTCNFDTYNFSVNISQYKKGYIFYIRTSYIHMYIIKWQIRYCITPYNIYQILHNN